MAIPTAVIHAALRQGGYVTRAQLVELGVSPSSIDRRIAGGDFIVSAAGTYQVLPSTDHVDLLTGAVLALPAAVVSHQSAAHLLDFPYLPALEPTVVVRSHTTHLFPGVTVRRCDDLPAAHTVRLGKLTCTNVARTAFDLAGILSLKEADQLVEALIVAERLRVKHLARLIDQLGRRGKRGTGNARKIVEARSGTDPDGTILERKGRQVLARYGLPDPVPQYPLPWDSSRRFDDAYPVVRFAIEWDSRSWHSQRAAMESDRRRDREAAIHGWVVARFTWQDVSEHPDEVASTVSSILESRRPAP